MQTLYGDPHVDPTTTRGTAFQVRPQFPPSYSQCATMPYETGTYAISFISFVPERLEFARGVRQKKQENTRSNRRVGAANFRVS